MVYLFIYNIYNIYVNISCGNLLVFFSFFLSVISKLEEDDRLHLLAADEDEEDQCIRLLSFCKKHRPPSNERLMAEDRIGQAGQQCSNYTPPCNPSGCARTGLAVILLN